MRTILALVALALSLSLTACHGSTDYVTVEFDGTTYACHITGPGTCKALVGGLYRTVHYDPAAVR